MLSSRISRSILSALILIIAFVGNPKLASADSFRPPSWQSQIVVSQPSTQEKLSPEVEQLIARASELYLQGKYAEAVPIAGEALELIRSKNATGHPQNFEIIMLKLLGDLYRMKGDYAQSETYFNEAIQLAVQLIDPNDAFNVSLQSSLGLLLLDKGEFARAEKVFEGALEFVERLAGTANSDYAAILNNKGMALYRLGEWVDAEQSFKRSITILEGAHAPSFAYPIFNISYPLNNITLLYEDMGRYDDAEETLQRALKIAEKENGDGHPFYAMILNNLGTLSIEKGDYIPAEQRLQRALAIQEKRLGPNNIEVSLTLNNLGALYASLGNYERAEAMQLRAIKIEEVTYSRSHPSFAASLSNLAALYGAQNDYPRAKSYLQQALDIQEKSLGRANVQVAQTLVSLATLNDYTGDYSLADSLLQRALKIYEQKLNPQNPTLGQFYNGYAVLLMRKGDFVNAELMQSRAIEIYEKAFGSYHPTLASFLSNLSWMYEAKGDYAESIRIQTRASNIYEHNITAIMNAGSENQKRLYMMTYEAGTSHIISLHLRSIPASNEAARLALTTILQRKGRALDAMTDQIGALRRRLNPQDNKVLEELSMVNSQLASLKSPEQYRANNARLGEEKERLEAQVSARSAEFRLESKVVTLERVQQSIPVATALVEMVLYYPFIATAKTEAEQWGNPRYAAYVLRHDGSPLTVDLGDAAHINKSILEFRSALGSPKNQDVKQTARALDELVMRPVRKLLGDTRMVLLSPDGELNLVPFAALVDENGHYLIENYTFNYLTSGRDLLRLEAQSQDRQQPIVFANPAFDIGVTSNDTKAAETAELNGRRSIDFNTARIGPLPGTAQEAAAIKNIMSAAQLFTERGATESALKGVAGPRFLHIATHGFFLQDQSQTVIGERRIGQLEQPVFVPGENPLLRSGLVFAGVKKGQSGAGEDGVLTALEASGLDLWGTKLVVLSACDTGVGQVANGDGVYGLRRALVLAGAESQLMTLWQVSDTATKDLIVDYYTRLQRGDGRAEAIRSAQLSMLTRKEMKAGVVDRRITGNSVAAVTNRSHPYYWASFIPIGDWRSITDSKKLSLSELFPSQTTVPLTPEINEESPNKRPPVAKSRVSKERVAATEKAPGKDNPKSFDGQMRAAARSRQLGNLAEAASCLEIAIELKPNDVDALTEMGNVKYDLGDFIGASSFYKRSLALQPNNSAVRADLGNTFVNQPSPDYSAAIEEYQKALRISPKDERVLHNLAVAALRKKSELTARDAINRLAEINPANSSLLALRSALASLSAGGEKSSSIINELYVVALHKSNE